MPRGRVRERKKTDDSGMNGEAKTVSSPSAITLHKVALQRERNSLVLWKKPLTTLYYFLLELLVLIQEFGVK